MRFTLETQLLQPVLVVYPNPSRGVSTAIFTAEAAGMATFTLSDPANTTIMEEQRQIKKGIVEFPIDLTVAAPGLYTLLVQTGAQVLQTKLVRIN